MLTLLFFLFYNTVCFILKGCTCFALSGLMYCRKQKDNEKMLRLTDGLLSRLVHVLNHDDQAVLLPLLNVFITISSGSEEQKRMVSASGVVPILAKLLNHLLENVVQNAAFTLLQLTCNTSQQVKTAFQSEICVLPIVLLGSEHIPETFSYAVSAFKNIAAENAELRDCIISENALGPTLKLIHKNASVTLFIKRFS